MKRYLLRNTTRYDINLGDIRYKIPAGQVRDLLGKTARLNIKDLEKSIVRGSIHARLKNGSLQEVVKYPDFSVPSNLELSKQPIYFPRQLKSSIILDVAELDEQLNNMMLNEEDDLLKSFEEDDENKTETPLITNEKTKD